MADAPAAAVIVFESLEELGNEGDVLLADLLQLLRYGHIAPAHLQDFHVQPEKESLVINRR